VAAASFHVSQKTAAKWVRRYRELGPAGLSDRTSRPHQSSRATSSPLIESVLALRRLRYNGWRIAQALALSRGHGQPHPAPRRHELVAFARSAAAGSALRAQTAGRPHPLRYQAPGADRHPGHRVHGDRTRETRGADYEYLHIASTTTAASASPPSCPTRPAAPPNASSK
jgi:hypothetical protein